MAKTNPVKWCVFVKCHSDDAT